MSIGNLVQGTLTTAITAASTVIIVDAAVAPYSLPPTGGGTLILSDSLSRPTRVEIIRYGARSGQNLTGVTRAQEGTTAQTWPVGALIYQSLTAAMFTFNMGNSPGSDSVGVALYSGPLDASNTIIQAATSTNAGVMTAADRVKLTSIAVGAQVNVATNLSITYAAAKATLASSTGTGVDINAATTSNAGLMSATDKTNLDGLGTTVANKVDKVSGKGLSTVDFTVAKSDKLTQLIYRNGEPQDSPFTAAIETEYLLTGSFAVTLPVLSSVTLGQKCVFQKFIDAAPTIQASGSDTIKTKSGTDTSVKFNINGTLTFVANTRTGTWEV